MATPRGKRHPQLGAIFAAIGLVVLIAGTIAGVRAYRWAGRAARAEGIVVANVGTHSRGHTVVAVVEFKTPEGRLIQFKNAVGGERRSGWTVGDRAAVLYDPSAPEDAVIDTFMSRYLLVVILVPFGAFFTLVGVALARGIGTSAV